MAPTLRFVSPPDALEQADALVLVGRSARLGAEDIVALLPSGVSGLWQGMLDSVSPGDAGGSTQTWVDGPVARVVAAVLPDKCSRHNSSGRPDAVTGLVKKAVGGGVRRVAVLLALDEGDSAFASGLAAARAFPIFDRKTSKKQEEGLAEVRIAFLGAEGDTDRLDAAAGGLRLAARLVDAPTSTLNTDAFVAEARSVAEKVGAEIEVIRGTELDKRGFGGLWGVGRAAVHPPALVILSHRPEGATETLAWVGKGIVYDTGGLSIKTKGGMPGMKADMGGAAAVLGAFSAAASLGAEQQIHALLCLAENSVGPDATRPDDILAMYSGKTVEVNNTDAEGRLVLADGVAYATRHLAPDVVVDLATLTGAQLISTGKRHAGIVCNEDDLEARAVLAGRSSGELVHPLPFVPEFYRKEFRSEVADMKNSVKDRMNAQTSCAAQFVCEHLNEDWEGSWLHVDLAGPSTDEEARGTGFGVGLLLELFGIEG
ncbi:MAG: leucyl aminopeptidase family protein [Myxococcota bacterium]|nr:leucyl aminopeptidase family protein [Myxococcota bacterium]